MACGDSAGETPGLTCEEKAAATCGADLYATKALEAAIAYSSAVDAALLAREAACVETAKLLGGEVVAEPTPEPDVERMQLNCAAAVQVVGTVTNGVSLSYQGERCQYEVESRSLCEKDCVCDTKCYPGLDDIGSRCPAAQVLVRCDGLCAGGCEGGLGQSVSCDGTCHGACTGECDGVEADGDPCPGTCSGSCEGACDYAANVELACAGWCHGTCSDSSEEQVCARALLPPSPACQSEPARCSVTCELLALSTAKCIDPGLGLRAPAISASERKALTPLLSAMLDCPYHLAFSAVEAASEAFEGELSCAATDAVLKVVDSERRAVTLVDDCVMARASLNL